MKESQLSNSVNPLTIPLHPRFIGSVIRQRILPSPCEGLAKALVDFSVRDRNLKPTKEQGAFKKLYDKRKTVAMAFLMYADKHGIKAYEKEFWPLDGKFCAGKALQASREFSERSAEQSYL